MEELIIEKIEFCARCGGTHTNLHAIKFKRPVEISEKEIYTHWVSCPTNGDPILAAKH